MTTKMTDSKEYSMKKFLVIAAITLTTFSALCAGTKKFGKMKDSDWVVTNAWQAMQHRVKPDGEWATNHFGSVEFSNAVVKVQQEVEAPVLSVNGKTGAVVLGAVDVGALANDEESLVANVNFSNAVVRASPPVEFPTIVAPTNATSYGQVADALRVNEEFVRKDGDTMTGTLSVINGAVGFAYLSPNTFSIYDQTSGNSVSWYPWDEGFSLSGYKDGVSRSATLTADKLVFKDRDSMSEYDSQTFYADKYGITAQAGSDYYSIYGSGAIGSSIGYSWSIYGGGLYANSVGYGDVGLYNEQSGSPAHIRFRPPSASEPYYLYLPYGSGTIALESWFSLSTTLYGTDASELAAHPTFSNAVLAVGLDIDTDSVAVLNEIAATFGDFPIEGTATTLGGLLAALAAAVAWLRKRAAHLDDKGLADSSFVTDLVSKQAAKEAIIYKANTEAGLKDRAFNALLLDGTEYDLSTALAAVTPTVENQPRDLLIVATATAQTTVSYTSGTIKGDKPTIDGAGTWLITLTEYAANTWYCRQIKMEDAK